MCHEWDCRDVIPSPLTMKKMNMSYMRESEKKTRRSGSRDTHARTVAVIHLSSVSAGKQLKNRSQDGHEKPKHKCICSGFVV